MITLDLSGRSGEGWGRFFRQNGCWSLGPCIALWLDKILQSPPPFHSSFLDKLADSKLHCIAPQPSDYHSYGSLGGVVVESPALSHFTQRSWVQTPVGSRDFLNTSTFPCCGRCPMGDKKRLAQKSQNPKGEARTNTERKKWITEVPRLKKSTQPKTRRQNRTDKPIEAQPAKKTL